MRDVSLALDINLVGPSTGAVSGVISGAGQIVVVRLSHADARALLPGHLASLRDRVLDLSELNPALHDRLDELRRAAPNRLGPGDFRTAIAEHARPGKRLPGLLLELVASAQEGAKGSGTERKPASGPAGKRAAQRLFARHIGVSPKAYATIARLHRAREMLLNNRSVVETAFETGYFDQSHFTKHFLKFHGSPPARTEVKPQSVAFLQDPAQAGPHTDWDGF